MAAAAAVRRVAPLHQYGSGSKQDAEARISASEWSRSCHFLPAAAAAAKAAAKVAQVAVAVAKWVAVAASLNLDCVQCHLRHFAKTLHVCDIVDNCFHNLMENLIKFTIKRAMLGTLPTVRFDVCSFSFLLPVRNELEKELYEHTAPSSFLFDVCMLPLRPVYFNIPDGTGNHGQLDLHVWRCWIKI